MVTIRIGRWEVELLSAFNTPIHRKQLSLLLLNHRYNLGINWGFKGWKKYGRNKRKTTTNKGETKASTKA